uniref:uncharacterized protein LOC120338389 isoform X1 n=1 Tax=Styela clava TaxID=7725 RepID=UPI0019399827|nr:uncharacterized protein LOC120338389 isoform X1 [Styela clava]
MASSDLENVEDNQERAIVPSTIQNKRVFNVVNVLYIDRIRRHEFAVPPFFKEHLRNVLYKDGKVVRFRCSVAGFPPPQIEWFKGPEKILEACDVELLEECIGYKYYASNNSGNLMLIITNILAEDFGPYTCKLTNTVGEARSTATLYLSSTTNKPVKSSKHSKRRKKKLVIEEKITIREKRRSPIKNNSTLGNSYAISNQENSVAITPIVQDDVMANQRNKTIEDMLTIMFAVPTSCETHDIKVTSSEVGPDTLKAITQEQSNDTNDLDATPRKFQLEELERRESVTRVSNSDMELELDMEPKSETQDKSETVHTPDSEGHIKNIADWIKCGETSDSEYRRGSSPYPIPRCLTENTDDTLKTNSAPESAGNSLDETSVENNKNEWLTSWRRKSGAWEEGSEEESKDTVGGGCSGLFSTGRCRHSSSSSVGTGVIARFVRAISQNEYFDRFFDRSTRSYSPFDYSPLAEGIFQFRENGNNYEGRSAFADVFEDDVANESKSLDTVETVNGIATFSDISPLSLDSETNAETIHLNPDFHDEDSTQYESRSTEQSDTRRISEDMIEAHASEETECTVLGDLEVCDPDFLSNNGGTINGEPIENESKSLINIIDYQIERKNEFEVGEDAARELDELIAKLIEFSQRNYVLVSSLKVGPSSQKSQHVVDQDTVCPEEITQTIASNESSSYMSTNEMQHERRNFPMHPIDMTANDENEVKPHAPEFVIPLENMEVTSDENVVLNISVTGYPAPIITWFKDGLPLGKKEESGIIHDNLKYQKAVYICVAENTLGESKTSATITIKQLISSDDANSPEIEQSAGDDVGVKLRQKPTNQRPPDIRRSQIISASLVDYLRWKAKLIQQAKISTENLKAEEIIDTTSFAAIPAGVDGLTRDDVTLRYGSMLSLASISTTSFESADEGVLTSSDAVWEDVMSTGEEDFMSTDEFFFPERKTNSGNATSFFLTTPSHGCQTNDSDDDLFNPRPLTPTPASPNPPLIYEIATEKKLRPFTRRPTDPRLLSLDLSEEMESARSENVTPVPTRDEQSGFNESAMKCRCPKFLVLLKDARVLLGASCSLTCCVIGDPEPDIAWYRNGIRILPPNPSSGKTSPHTFISSFSSVTPHQRFNITSEVKREVGKDGNAFEYTSHELTISDCRNTDAGEYLVTAVNIYGNIMSKARIIIKSENSLEESDSNVSEFTAPHFVATITDSDGMIGEETTMTFQLSGQPEPDINIFHNREEVEEGKFTLSTDDGGTYIITIKDLQLEDEGEIRVCAMNVVGCAECSAELFVDERSATPTPGKIGFFQWPEHLEDGEYGTLNIKEQLAMQVITPFFDVVTDDVTVSIGSEASFAVRVLAWPAPEVFWYKEGKLISGDRFRLESPDFGTHVLTIGDVVESDAGIYTCTVKNCSGDVSCKAELVVTAADVTSDSSANESLSEIEQWNLKDYYNICRDIGFGCYSLVRLVQDKQTEIDEYAAKYIRCSHTKSREKLLSEIEILKKLSHKNIVIYKEYFETKKHIVLVMEYIDMEWFEFLLMKESVYEREIAANVKDICCGIMYLHRNQVVHLDMKPENIMITADGSTLKIIDFGSSKEVKSDKEIMWNYGNPEFVSPEVVKSIPVSTASDMWSLGVIVYVVISGISPFLGESDYATVLQVRDGKWHLDSRWFSTVSLPVKDFIQKLLVLEPTQRMSATEAASHNWLCQQVNDEGPLPDGRLKYFITRRKWQRSLVSPKTSLTLRSISSLLKREYDSSSVAISRTLASEYISSSTMTESEDDVTPSSVPTSPRFQPRSYKQQQHLPPISPRKKTTSISIEDILEQEKEEITPPTVKIVDSTPKSSPTKERKFVIKPEFQDSSLTSGIESLTNNELKENVEKDVEKRFDVSNVNLASQTRPVNQRKKLQMIGKKVSFDDHPINPIVFEETKEMVLCEQAEIQETTPPIQLGEQKAELDLPPVAQMPELPVPESASGPPGITLDRPQSVSQLLKEDRRQIKPRRVRGIESTSTKDKIKKKLSSITSRRHRSFDIHSSSSEEDLRANNHEKSKNSTHKDSPNSSRSKKLSFFSRRKKQVVKGSSLDSSLNLNEMRKEFDEKNKQEEQANINLGGNNTKPGTEKINSGKTTPIKGILKHGGAGDTSSHSDPYIQKSLHSSRTPSPKIISNMEAYFPKQYQRRPLAKGVSLDLDMVAESNGENGSNRNRTRPIKSAAERRRTQLRRGSSAESALNPPPKSRVSGLRGPLLEKGGDDEDEPMAGMSLRRSLPGGAQGSLHNHSRSYSGPLNLHSPGFERGKFSPLALSPRGPLPSPMGKYSSLSRSYFSQSVDISSVRPSEKMTFEERMTGKKSLSAQLPTSGITLPRSRSQDRPLGRRSKSSDKRLATESYPPCLKVPLVDQGVIRNQECVTLKCLIDAFPLPEITWYKDGEEINASDRIEIISEASITRFQLKIRKLKLPHDYGEYQCEARNSVGILKTSCILKLAVVPDKPSVPDFSGTDGANVWISWNPPTNCAAFPMSYILQYREMAGMQWIVASNNIKDTLYKVENLRPTTSYRFRVCAVNNGGIGPYSKVSQRIQIDTHAKAEALQFAF